MLFLDLANLFNSINFMLTEFRCSPMRQDAWLYLVFSIIELSLLTYGTAIISVRWTLSEALVAAEFRTYLKPNSRIFPAHYRLGNSATWTKDIMC